MKAQSCPTLGTPWTWAWQTPLSMGFSRQEYWSGLPFSSLGDLPDPGIEPRSLALQVKSLPCEPPGKPKETVSVTKYEFVYPMNSEAKKTKTLEFGSEKCLSLVWARRMFDLCSKPRNPQWFPRRGFYSQTWSQGCRMCDFFWLVFGQVTWQCCRNVVFNLRVQFSIWLWDLVLAEELKGILLCATPTLHGK